MRHPPFPDTSSNCQRQPQYSNKNLEQNFKPQSCQTRIKYSQRSIKIARKIHINLKEYFDDFDIDLEDFDDESKQFDETFLGAILGGDLEKLEIKFKPKDSILERLPDEIRQMIFVFCGRNTFCSADQGPRLLKALRGQRSAYAHALSIFERLNSYELGVELKTRTSEIRHNVHDMIGLMTVDKALRNFSPQSNSNNSELAESDLKLTLQ